MGSTTIRPGSPIGRPDSRPGPGPVGGTERIADESALTACRFVPEPGSAAGSRGREAQPPEHDHEWIIVEDPAATELLSTAPAPRACGAAGDGGEADGSPAPARRENPLTRLAEQIARHRARMLRAARAAVEEHIQIGLALIEAKAHCKHGRWSRFLERCGLNPRTAEQCMQFARHRDLLEQESHGRADLTVEAFRRLIASRTGAISRRPKERAVDVPGFGATCGESDRTDSGISSAGHHQGDASVEPAETDVAPPGESGSPASAIESRAEGTRIGDPAEPVDPRRPDTDREQPGQRAPDPTGRESQASTDGSPVAELRRRRSETAPRSVRQGPSNDPVAAHDDQSAATTGPDHLEPGDHASRPSSVAAELSDEEWLAAIPLRAEIRDRRRFDEEATLWRRLRPEILRIREQLGASTQEIKNSAYLHPDKYRLRVRLVVASHVRPPAEWARCESCAGGCVEATSGLPCTRCSGWGFFIEHEGNDRADASGGADRSAGATPGKAGAVTAALTSFVTDQ